MALQKAGIQAGVYEAYRDTADGVGAGLSIAPNGLNALSVLEADEVVRCIGIPMTAVVIQSWTGKQLAEFVSPPSLPTMQFGWRGELYRALCDEATRRGLRIEYGKQLVEVTDTAEGVTARARA